MIIPLIIIYIIVNIIIIKPANNFMSSIRVFERDKSCEIAVDVIVLAV